MVFSYISSTFLFLLLSFSGLEMTFPFSILWLIWMECETILFAASPSTLKALSSSILTPILFNFFSSSDIRLCFSCILVSWSDIWGEGREPWFYKHKFWWGYKSFKTWAFAREYKHVIVLYAKTKSNLVDSMGESLCRQSNISWKSIWKTCSIFFFFTFH